MNTPRYRMCELCGRNPHKVAVCSPGYRTYTGLRVPEKVVGYCPSCVEIILGKGGFRPGTRIVYDRRKRNVTPLTIQEEEG